MNEYRLPATLGMALCVLAALSHSAVAQSGSRIESDDALTIQYGVWYSGPEPMRVTERSSRFSALLDGDRQLLRQWSNTGRVEIMAAAVTRIAPAPAVRIMVIFTGTLTAPASLKIPEAGEVLYVQEGNNFRQIPSQIALTARVLEIKPVAGKTELYDTSIEHPRGGRSGGQVYLPRGQRR